MPSIDELSRVIDRSHDALDRFVAGDAEPMVALYSRSDDVTIANPFGPPVRGWAQATAAMRRAATYFRGGRAIDFERVSECTTPGLAYVVEVERYEARIDGSEAMTPVTLRVTTILRPEDGTWRIVHRHADPITASRPAASLTRT